MAGRERSKVPRFLLALRLIRGRPQDWATAASTSGYEEGGWGHDASDYSQSTVGSEDFYER